MYEFIRSAVAIQVIAAAGAAAALMAVLMFQRGRRAARCWRPPSAAGAGRRCFALWAYPTPFCSRRPRRAAAAEPT